MTAPDTAAADVSPRLDVCLVSMPFAVLPRPSLALGLLKAALEREGIATRVVYPTLRFAREIGPARYHLFAQTLDVEFQAGEWVFAEAAFPGAERNVEDDEEYLRRIATAPLYALRYDRHEDDTRGHVVAALREARRAAAGFVAETAREVLALRPRIVGCTSTFAQHAASLALLRRIREIDPSIVTMMGGGNCEGAMGRATHRSFPWVDFVVSGEADLLIAGLCLAILERGREIPKEALATGVFGPAHRDGGGARLRALSGHGNGNGSVPRAVVQELDLLPVPDFTDYFDALGASSLAEMIRPGLPLETSRGCWWGAIRHCTFCGLNGGSMAYRAKAPARVMDEVRQLEERYGISNFEAVDNILDMGYFGSLLPALAADGRERRIFYEVKPNLKRAQVEMLRRAGIRWIQPGIESLHSEVLRRLDKGVQGWQNVQLLRWSRELGVRVGWNYLWGLPDDEDGWYADMAAWLPAIEHLQPPFSVVRIRYDRFSVYHQRPESYGLTLRPVPAMGFIYPLPEAELAELSYYFAADGRAELLDGSGRDGMEGRPGTRALRDGVERWRQAFWRPSPPLLSVADDGAALDVRDTRSCASAPRVRLASLDRAVYLACEEAPLERGLAAAAAKQAGTALGALGGMVDEGEVAQVAERLKRSGLVLPLDGRLVALGVRRPVPALPLRREFPGGTITDPAGPELQLPALLME